MDRFEGQCVGGPYDGMMLAHTSKTKEFYRPMVGFMPMGDPPVIPVPVGEYRLNDFGQWHWWATKEGKAMDALMGPPRS